MGSGKGKPSTHKGKGKGRNPWHTGYFAETTSVQDDWEEEFAEDIVEDEEPLVGLLAGADEEEPEEDEYEHEEVEEWESIALNAMADLEGSPDIDASSLGESIQLQIAALAAFGKAKGKKGKGKGKVIKSGLTLAQRRAKLQEIKSKSRCMRCGATGHWAGDPACKFPGARKPSPSNGPSQKGSSPQARMAMLACISESSCDEEEVVLSPSTLDHAAAFVVCPKPSRREQPRASDEVSSDISMAARPKVMPKSPPPQAQGYASQASSSSSTAVVQAYRGPVAKMPAPKSKSVAKRTPPFPPLEKC